MIRKISAVAVVFLMAVVLFSEQTQDQKIAALEQKLAKVSGKEKITVLNKLAGIYFDKSPKKCIEYGNQSIKLSQKTGDLRGEATALRFIAIGYSIMGDHEKGLACFQKAREKFEKAGDKQGAFNVLRNIGIVNYRTGNHDKALEIFLEVLAYEKEADNKPGMAVALMSIGNAYSIQGKHTLSLDYHLQALKIREESGNKPKIADSCYNIGLLYAELNKLDLALAYLKKSEDIWGKMGNKRSLSDLSISFGDVYIRQKNYEQAMKHLRIGLKTSGEIGDKRSQSYALGNIGHIFLEKGDYKEALKYAKKSMKISEEISDKWGICKSHFGIGKLYAWLGNFAEAKKNIERGFEVGKELGKNELIRDGHETYSILYEAKKEYKKALEYYKKFHQTDKEIFNEKSSEQLTELQTRYDTLKKEKENEILKNKNKIQALQLSRSTITRNSLIAGFILVCFIFVLLFKKYLHLFAFWKKEKYIGQFRLMDKIGSGAMGTIHKAHNIVDKSQVTAVKILREEFFTDESAKKRFKREALIIDKLEHPHIIKIYERGEYKEKLFIAMEWLKGRTLENKIMEEGQLDLKEALHIMTQLADALAFIHSKKIIHRDLKPGNIMLVERDGDANFVKLLDFGLAKMEFQTRLTQSGNFVGTIEYVSPEQLLNADSSPANDIFSLGVTFYKMLCGRSPFPGETVVEVMGQVLKTEPPVISECRGGIPAELDALIMKMLSKKPKQRPSAKSISDILGSF